jgi:hypothetical protein
MEFIEDYDRENPVTSLDAWKSYIEMLERKDKKQAE